MDSIPKRLCCDPCSNYVSYVKRIEGNGVYVTGIPFGVGEEELYNEFSHYGQIADFYLADSETYLVNFEHRRSQEDVLTHPVRILGRELKIRSQFTSQTDADKRAELSQIDDHHEEVWKSIPQDKDFKYQVEEFLKAVEADTDYSRKAYEVCRDLEIALKHISATYKIILFGSSINGLALKGSDLDISYERDAAQTKDAEVLDIGEKIIYALENLKTLEAVRPIPNLRLPVFEFIHKPTGLDCDLTFNNAIAVQNSKLTKFVVSLDPRIKQLFIIVIYWAKLHHLTGKRFYNWGLTLLLINFLQSLDDPILPPLYELQHAGVERMDIGDWNANFDDSATRLRPISNDLPVEELLSRFFESVLQTDFENYVVSPLFGSLIHRDVVHGLVKLPREFKDYVYNVNIGRSRLPIQSPLCIQAPFELNYNVTKDVPVHDFKCLKEHCSVASRLRFTTPAHLYLSKLLSTSYKYPEKNDHQTAWLPNPIHVRPLKSYMTVYVPRPDSVTDEVIWMNNVTQKVTLIFKKILKIHVDNSFAINDTKPGGDQTLECQGSQVLWSERNKLWEKWHSKSSAISESFSGDEVEVVHVSDKIQSSNSERRTTKKKHEGDNREESTIKRLKRTSDNDKQGTSQDGGVDVIDLDSEDTTTSIAIEGASLPRSLQEEIDLTNEMVKKGHALSASNLILDFTCKICKSSSDIRIEISDYRSRSNYFSALCMFLEDFLNMHIINVENS